MSKLNRLDDLNLKGNLSEVVVREYILRRHRLFNKFGEVKAKSMFTKKCGYNSSYPYITVVLLLLCI